MPKSAAKTEDALFLVIDVGKMGKKLTKIQELQKAQRAAGQRVSEILVVDAKTKLSASKRNSNQLV